MHAPNKKSTCSKKTDRTEKKSRLIYNYHYKHSNTHLSETYRTGRQKISKHTELNNDVNQLDLTDIYRIFHQTIEEYAVLSNECETFTKIDNILQILTNLKELKL